MLGVQLAALQGETPAGCAAALDLVDGFDQALEHGFARLGEERAQAVVALAAALAGSPLGERAAEAAAKVATGVITEDHLLVLAGARTAVLGAVHDALLATADAALGRTRATWPGQTQAASASSAGVASWLAELAITGWRGVDHDLVSAASQPIEAVLGDPATRGLAVLLDGFAAELHASCPIGTMPEIPARRWGDLWARAMLLTRGEPAAQATPVTGRLLPLGVDVHEHATAVQAQLHAVLERPGGERELVRASVVAAKVDTITGPAVWRLFGAYPSLLAAMAEHRAVELSDMPLTPAGDLLWDESLAKPGDPADPFATARVLLAESQSPPTPPLHRHPVRLAEPVLVEGYTGDGRTLRLDGYEIPLTAPPATGPVTTPLVKASKSCVALLCWDDGRWMLRPLAVQGKKGAHNGEWALATDAKIAKAGEAVGVLRERAGRLLRK
ncbi:hypothetical protein OIE66_13160 [Nonomuraea sp. NBC_01738]|uniref:hypothetical protein n=1 Tax=Nonomuraea sp. NBC_01738 TaxID=2976003 RepID=UPI002E161FED|nr:hypothetical protein OIE66_13160 [Nonomuraea sp. NBC_01738]